VSQSQSPPAEAREELTTTTWTSPHRPLTASDQTYGPGNTRPAWADQLPDPDTEAARFTGSAWFQTTTYA
jgi:hypothetical protein